MSCLGSLALFIIIKDQTSIICYKQEETLDHPGAKRRYMFNWRWVNFDELYAADINMTKVFCVELLKYQEVLPAATQTNRQMKLSVLTV